MANLALEGRFHWSSITYCKWWLSDVGPLYKVTSTKILPK
jgi:hypothetical protein